MSRVICGEWPATSERAPSTVEAEVGLGITDEPCYFYVMRTDEQFGMVVFLLKEADDAKWPADAHGATPFDSGGWWKGLIKTDPYLHQAARREKFKAVDVHLQAWQSAFRDYVAGAYAADKAMQNYIMGETPEHRSTVVEIVLTEQNSPRAWTWEVRMPPSMIADRVQPHSACMTSEDKSEYIDWVVNEVPESDRQRGLMQWVRANVHSVSVGGPAGVVQRKLVDWVERVP